MKPVLVVGGMLARRCSSSWRRSSPRIVRSVTTTRPRPPPSRRRCRWITRQTAGGQTAKGMSFAGAAPDNAAELAKAHKPYPAALPPLTRGRRRQGAHGPEGRHDRDRAGHQVRGLGLRGRRAGPRRPRAAGPDSGDDADERRRDPTLDRLPRGADRAQPRLRRRDARQVVHVPLQGERPRRVHVPLRHQAGAHAHRERHVRRDRRRPGDAPAEGRPLVRARRERVVPLDRRARRARAVRHQQGARDDARLDDVQRLRRASTSRTR